MDEYMVILEHVLGSKIPKEANEIIKLCDGKKSWKSLESKLERNAHAIAHRWSDFIHPTILAHLSGTVNLDWEKNFFQYIIDKKYVSVTNIDWNIVLDNWPFCTKSELSKKVIQWNKKGVPLYQNIAENLHRMRVRREASQLKLDLINEFEKLKNKD